MLGTILKQLQEEKERTDKRFTQLTHETKKTKELHSKVINMDAVVHTQVAFLDRCFYDTKQSTVFTIFTVRQSNTGTVSKLSVGAEVWVKTVQLHNKENYIKDENDSQIYCKIYHFTN